MKLNRVRSSLRWAVKLSAGGCVILGGVVVAVLPMVHGQAAYLIASTVAALAIQTIALLLIVTACQAGHVLSNWLIRWKHVSRRTCQGYQPHTALEMN